MREGEGNTAILEAKSNRAALVQARLLYEKYMYIGLVFNEVVAGHLRGLR